MHRSQRDQESPSSVHVHCVYSQWCVYVSSFSDISAWSKLTWAPFPATTSVCWKILKHLSCVSELSMLSYGFRYPISNLCRVVIPYLAMTCHYFESCYVHDLRQRNIIYIHIQNGNVKLPLSSIQGPDGDVALISIFFEPPGDQSLFDL